ncbi:hypothetical protein J6590_005506 [Homalodisca vitripennis]|nr:hypothetical protein J6590_005506 [Homalodisca vitripennis]
MPANMHQGPRAVHTNISAPCTTVLPPEVAPDGDFFHRRCGNQLVTAAQPRYCKYVLMPKQKHLTLVLLLSDDSRGTDSLSMSAVNAGMLTHTGPVSLSPESTTGSVVVTGKVSDQLPLLHKPPPSTVTCRVIAGSLWWDGQVQDLSGLDLPPFF